MFGYGIEARLCSSFFLVLMIVIHNSCVQSISDPDSENIQSESIQILDTSIELDRFENELFFTLTKSHSYPRATII